MSNIIIIIIIIILTFPRTLAKQTSLAPCAIFSSASSRVASMDRNPQSQ